MRRASKLWLATAPHQILPVAALGGLHRHLPGEAWDLSKPKANYETHNTPLLINITRISFSASAPPIAAVIYNDSDIAAPAFKHEQHLCRQRHLEEQPRYGGLEPRRKLDATNHP